MCSMTIGSLPARARIRTARSRPSTVPGSGARATGTTGRPDGAGAGLQASTRAMVASLRRPGDAGPATTLAQAPGLGQRPVDRCVVVALLAGLGLEGGQLLDLGLQGGQV